MKKSHQAASRKRWLTFAIGGLLCFGFGLSLLGEAILQRVTGASFWTWTTWGTAALIVTNSGLCLFGQAIVERGRITERARRTRTEE
ncbi:MAG: hypothetical protein ACFB10_14665 [Salibacteraceae bacterium]